MTVADVQLSPVTKIAELAFRELGVKYRDTNGKNMFGESFPTWPDTGLFLCKVQYCGM